MMLPSIPGPVAFLTLIAFTQHLDERWLKGLPYPYWDIHRHKKELERTATMTMLPAICAGCHRRLGHIEGGHLPTYCSRCFGPTGAERKGRFHDIVPYWDMDWVALTVLDKYLKIQENTL